MTRDKILALGLRKAFGLGAAQSLLRLALGFASIKVTAVWIGPGGLALVAQINNFIGLCQGVIANPASTAVVRLGAEYADHPAQRRALQATAMQWVLACGLLVALPLAVLAPWISPRLLAGQDHPWALVIAALAVPALCFNNIVVSAFSAAGELKPQSRIQMISTVAGFLVFVPATYAYGLGGALVASSVVYLVGAGIAAATVRPNSPFSLADFAAPGSRTMLGRILSFYPMLIVHAGLTPLSLMLVRDQLVQQAGLDGAGLWQAGWRLSEIYLSLLMAPFSMYFMAKLGALIDDRAGFRHEVLRSMLRAAAVTAPVALAIFLLRPWIIRIVFAPGFAPVSELLPWQLAGDVVKMSAWMLTMALTALMRTRWFVVCELARAGAFVAGTYALSAGHGPVAANWAYFGSSLLLLLLAAIGLRDRLTAAPRRSTAGDGS